MNDNSNDSCFCISEKEIKWYNFYMKIACMYAEFSKDPRTKVGSIIVPGDFSKILSVGCNGWAKGEPDVPDSLELGCSGAVHSEINCMLKFFDFSQNNCLFFCSHSCCRVCARAIVNFGRISKFIYKEDYRDLSGLDILRSAGIEVIKVSPCGAITKIDKEV